MNWLLFKHKETSRMTIDIDMENGAVLITQRWRMVDKGNNSSASIEHFKRMVASTVQAIWNQRCFVNLVERDLLKNKIRRDTFVINFKVRWVSSNEHWRVYMQPEGVSSVDWCARNIYLDVYDVRPQRKKGAPKGLCQYPVAHEFGHTIGNVRGAFPSLLMGIHGFTTIHHGDEYRSGYVPKNKTEEYVEDINSIMNIGNSLRKRHLDYILQELNSMCSSFGDSYFEVDEVI